MAKKTQMNPYDRRHLNNLRKYQNAIDEIFREVTVEAAKIGVSVNPGDGGSEYHGSFYKDFPAAAKKVNALIGNLQKRTLNVITTGIGEEWRLANEKNDALVTQIFGSGIRAGLSDALRDRYFAANTDVMDAFIKRKEKGMNLSDQVWNLTDKYKTELELGLETGLREGRTAAELSRDLRMYLNNPTALFRRVRDADGNLVLSRRARAYHPGAGVYRSAYKNALRLTATEINMAYRTADHERWQNLDFVVGIHIGLSNNHTLNGQPFTDICDTLSGDYPKGFKFVGWHPHCRCLATTILKTDAELKRDEQRIMNGEEPESAESSRNYVENVPDGFTGWIEENQDRITAASANGTLPYFITDNRATVDGIIDASAGEDATSSSKLRGRNSPSESENANSVFFMKKFSSLNEMSDYMDSQKVEYIEAGELTRPLSDTDIISKVGSYDKTAGSCVSQTLAYIGNKFGYDVQDYRGGDSWKIFKNMDLAIARLSGGIIRSDKNEIDLAKGFYENIKPDKEYILNVGDHFAIVRRKNKNEILYLELQEANSGFRTLTDNALTDRFDCKTSNKSKRFGALTDIEFLRDKAGFWRLLGYLNTKRKL